jgi:hypothetical protein
MVAAPLPSQALFLNQAAIDYKMHIIECVGLLLSPRHAAECGGTLPMPSLNSLSTPVSGGTPPPAPTAPVVVKPDPCLASFLPNDFAVGQRIHIAVDVGCPPPALNGPFARPPTTIVAVVGVAGWRSNNGRRFGAGCLQWMHAGGLARLADGGEWWCR